MKRTKIGKKCYYAGKDIMDYYLFPKGYKERPREIVNKGGFPVEHVLYTSTKNVPIKDQDNPSPGARTWFRAKEFQKWIQEYEIEERDEEQEDQKRPRKLVKRSSSPSSNSPPKNSSKKLVKYAPPPPLMTLAPSEHFPEADVEVEVRGTRSETGCFFKATDLSKLFGIDDVGNTIRRNNKRHSGNYEEGIDYAYFSGCRDIVPSSKKIDKQSNPTSGGDKELFITYEGMLKLVMFSKSEPAKKFRRWATKILYTHHLGTPEQRVELGARLMGIPLDQMRESLSATGKVCVVYLLILGQVKDLRNTFQIPDSIPDDKLLCKYGKSNNFNRRLRNHKKVYGEQTNVTPTVYAYSMVMENQLTEAESSLSDQFDCGQMKHLCTDETDQDRKELVLIDSKNLKKVKKRYGEIGEIYGNQATHTAALRIQELENEVQLEKTNRINAQEMAQKAEEHTKKAEEHSTFLQNMLNSLMKKFGM